MTIIVTGDFPKTMLKLCISTKFPHQEIRWYYGILRSVSVQFSFAFYVFTNHFKC